MGTISATVIKAVYDKVARKAEIVVEFDDKKGKWQKVYPFATTEPISFDYFKELVTKDIKKDLGVKNNLTNIEPQIGKAFTITV